LRLWRLVSPRKKWRTRRESGEEMKKPLMDRVWNFVFWLWETPITWGQVVLYILLALLVGFIKRLLH
jgi:hypothetical protein